MFKTFRHGGKIGDVIFSLPTIRELGGGILYLPESTPDHCPHLYGSLKDLLLLQPYIKEVREYPSGLPYMKQAPEVHIDYDLDLARLQPLKGVIHIVKRYMDAFNINYPKWKEPWLVVDDEKSNVTGYDIRNVNGKYSVINYTGRHIKNDYLGITSPVDWERVYHMTNYPPVFIGLEYEYERFRHKFKVHPPFVQTANVLEMARVIRDAQDVYCNQSCTLALAQAMGKQYYLDVKPQKSNCLLYTPNEHLL